MKLEFETGNIPDSVYKELGFEEYLDIFDTGVRGAPSILLKPMSKQEGEEHYGYLQKLQRVFDRTFLCVHVLLLLLVNLQRKHLQMG